MTPEKFLNGGNFKVLSANQFIGTGVFKVVTDEKPGYVDRLRTAFDKRTENVNQAKDRLKKGQQGLASTILQGAGQFAGATGDIIGEAIAPAVEATGIPQKVGELPAVQNIAKNYEAWKSAHPEAAANLEATINIASILPLPRAATIAGKAAATGAGAAIEGAGTGAAAAGRATKAAGKVLNSTGFTPNVAEAERVLSYRAASPFLTRAQNALAGVDTPGKPRLKSDTALEKGIAGTETMIGVQAKREADSLWKQKIDPAVKASDAIITRDELFAPAEQLVAATTDPTRRKALETALEALREDYADTDTWTLDVAQALKRDLDSMTPAKVFRGQDVKSEVRMLQHAMADGIRQKTYNALSDVNIKKDYLDWANLHELEQLGVKAISEAKLKGGFGGFWTAMWDMTTTPIKTIGGQVLYRVGNTLEFAAEKGIKRFGEFLKQKGFQRPSSAAGPSASTQTK